MNFKFSVFTIIAVLLYNLSFSQTKTPQFRIIHNNDGTDALSNMWFDLDKPLTVSDVENYVDMVAGTQVTTYMMCTGSDFVYYDSKYARTFCDDLNGTIPCNSKPETIKSWKRYDANIKRLQAEGTDVIATSLKRAKQKGMETFVTFRMNDLHFADTTEFCALVYPDFWINNPQYWLGDATQGYHSVNALDFSHKEVREYKKNLITEQLGKYDMIDGFDLDFMRFAVFFKGDEGAQKAPIMTQMVKDIKAKVDSVGKIRGKKILLSVRVPITMEGCMLKGLNVKEWVRLGLVDFISIGAHWPGETATPVAKFKKDLRNNKIPVYGTIDHGGYTPYEPYSHGMYRGMASHILAQGDGIHLFNYYFNEYNRINKGKIVLSDSGTSCRYPVPMLLNELGSAKTLIKRNKIYCASDGTTPAYRVLQVTDLPLGCGRGKRSEAKIFVGEDVAVTKPEEIILFVRTDRKANFILEVNGIRVKTSNPEYPSRFDRMKGMKETDEMYAFILPANSIKKGDNQVSIMATSGLFLTTRLEIALNYGDVETYGYF